VRVQDLDTRWTPTGGPVLVGASHRPFVAHGVQIAWTRASRPAFDGPERMRGMPDVEDRLRATVEELAALDRLPCSAGEREAAQRIAGHLRDLGIPAVVEEERVHGTYITPIVLCSAAGALVGHAALRGRLPRLAAAALAAGATGLLWQDLGGGPRRWLRRRLPQAPTWNVVGRVGPTDAPRTVVVHAHHDAARTSPIFGQDLPELLWSRFPELMGRLDRYPPVMWLVLAGPGLTAAGALAGLRPLMRLGVGIAVGTVGVMGHMRTQPVVPGANDNLTAVAAIVELGRRLQDDPLTDVQVVLLSAGAEESNQDGMLAFMRRHGPLLQRDRTEFVCLDSIGSPTLVLIEGEGFVKMRDYDPGLRDRVAAAAQRAGRAIRRGLRFTFATDGLAPLREGYRVCAIGSVNAVMMPSNYHWPTDTPDNVDFGTVASAVDVVEALLREGRPAPAAAPAG
jgi:hypothetical protein